MRSATLEGPTGLSTGMTVRPVRVSLPKAILALGLVILLAPPVGATDPDTDVFSFEVKTDQGSDGLDRRSVGIFRYERALTTPTLDAPAGWTDGDRISYRCGYAFLVYRGFLVGRVTFTRVDPPPPADPYTRVNDRYMAELLRHYDGTYHPHPELQNVEEPHAEQCPEPEDAYEPLVGDPGPVPVVTFQHGPHSIDIRDFADSSDLAEVDPGHRFRLVKATAERVTVIAYEDGVPVLAIYYDRLISEVLPGTMHAVTLVTSLGSEPTPQPSSDQGDEPTPEPDVTPEAGPVHMGKGERLVVECQGRARVRTPSSSRVVIRCRGLDLAPAHSLGTAEVHLLGGERLVVLCEGDARVRRPSRSRVVIRCR